ncbi:hypothetical protein B0H11DRAFT_2327412 [Mycena galericulata]|nr:hypothetical protein B0H11DRAFT_2327412 [Mycena galericulata]
MSEIEILKARLLIAEADKNKKTRKDTTKNKENKDNGAKKSGTNKGGEETKKKKRRAPTVQWAKAPFHHLTDTLLTIIEGSARYKQAFGFDKGQSGPVDTGGKTLPDLCSDVAAKLLKVNEDESDYTSASLPGLADVIKNRVNNLKKTYTEHHEKLGATGHGLVTAGKEAKIIEGSDIANAWEAIAKKFPWYKRMDILMGTSPIVNRSAVAHSNTRVDLSVLDRDGKAHDGPISVKDDSSSDGDIFSDWSSSSPVAKGRSVARDDAIEEENDAVGITYLVKAEPSSVSASSRGTKRKTTHEHVAEIASQDHVQLREKAKTVRARERYDAKTQLEMARLKHQEAEALGVLIGQNP